MTGSALRVGLVVPRFAPFHGGMETYTAQAAAALAAKGAEVTVVTQVPRGCRAASAGMRTTDTPSSATTCRSATSSTCPPRRRPVRRGGPDASTSCGCTATTRPWPGWRRSRRRPHSCSPRTTTGAATLRLRQALHRAYRPAGRRLMAASRRIVVDTDAEAGLVLRDFPRHVHRDKITVVPLAVADPVRGRQPYPGESPVVLTVARQEPYKRTDLLVRAVVELRSRAVPARLVVVGDGSGLAACRELAARLGAEDVVTFTGRGRRGDARTLVGVGVAVRDRESAGGVRHRAGRGARRRAPRRRQRYPRSPRGHPPRRVRRAGRLCEVDAPDIDAASQYADAMAELLSSTDSCKERAARCTLPSAADMADQLLETLTSAGS